MAHGTPGPLGAFPCPWTSFDINGRRFTNEDIPGQTFSNIAEEQPQKVYWQIADAQYPNQLKVEPTRPRRDHELRGRHRRLERRHRDGRPGDHRGHARVRGQQHLSCPDD